MVVLQRIVVVVGNAMVVLIASPCVVGVYVYMYVDIETRRSHAGEAIKDSARGVGGRIELIQRCKDAEYSQTRSANEGAAHGVGCSNGGRWAAWREESVSISINTNECPCNLRPLVHTQPIPRTQRRRHGQPSPSHPRSVDEQRIGRISRRAPAPLGRLAQRSTALVLQPP